MTDQPDFKTFDIADMFTGTAYPTEVVSVYTNADVAYRFHKLIEAAIEAVKSQDDAEGRRIEDERKRLQDESERFRYEFHLRGQSQERLSAIYKKAKAEHPPKVSGFLQQEQNTEEFYEALQIMTWALMVERIVAPGGAVKATPSEDEIRALVNNLPASETNKISEAISEMTEGSKSGFEALAKEHDFLSGASVEA